MPKARKLVVVHPGSRTSEYSPVQCISFDIFCDKNELPEELRDLLEEVGYDAKECSYVQRFGTEDYYISTDTCYSYNLAVKVIKALVELVRQGFEVVYAGE